ncbi:MAG: hypothetical protein AAB019_10625 [Planctomycetota bacterium]
MTNSIWPYDTFLKTIRPNQDVGKITCFLLCPSKPQRRWDDTYNFIKEIGSGVASQLGLNFVCERAVDIASSGIIHPEIWDKIKHSDILIADITGQNGNVLLELGVASAWRKKEHVIILKEDNPEEPDLFDINPARHISYTSTFNGFVDLTNKLSGVLTKVIATLPFEALPDAPIKLPLDIDFTIGQDSDKLISHSTVHRRIVNDYLEFGALYIYSYSWLSLGNLKIKNVSVQSEMKFTKRKESNKINSSWIGIMLRGQSFWANSGHLIYLRDDGIVIRTVPENELGTYKDVEVGKINDFNSNSNTFIQFALSIDDKHLNIKVGTVKESIKIAALPFVFNEGRVQIQTAWALVGIKNIQVKQL